MSETLSQNSTAIDLDKFTPEERHQLEQYRVSKEKVMELLRHSKGSP